MRILDYIRSNGDTINSLSKKTNISYTTLYQGVHNPKQMKFDNFLKIARYYDISLDYLSLLVDERKTTLLSILKDQMESKTQGDIYHYTQVNFAYNSNRIKGSKLTEKQTQMMYENSSLDNLAKSINTDDLVETANTFYLFDEMLKVADKIISEEMIMRFHQILKNGTNDSRKEGFVVGGYKLHPNEVNGETTTDPKDVARSMKKLINEYQYISNPNMEDILDFHYHFERIHPFQDGNGRIGRLLIFKECLRLNIVPFIIDNRKKASYYQGLRKSPNDRDALLNTCKTMQKSYEKVINKYLSDVDDKASLINYGTA